MSEIVDVLEECIELVESEEYLIDKVIMMEQRAIEYIDGLREFLDVFLLGIKTEFPDIDKFDYRRLIFPKEINSDEEGRIKYEDEKWEVMKSSKYTHGGYEVFLKREK